MAFILLCSCSLPSFRLPARSESSARHERDKKARHIYIHGRVDGWVDRNESNGRFRLALCVWHIFLSLSMDGLMEWCCAKVTLAFYFWPSVGRKEMGGGWTLALLGRWIQWLWLPNWESNEMKWNGWLPAGIGFVRIPPTQYSLWFPFPRTGAKAAELREGRRQVCSRDSQTEAGSQMQAPALLCLCRQMLPNNLWRNPFSFCLSC